MASATDRPEPKDLSYHYSRVTRNRNASSIKSFYKYFTIPGIGNLAGGVLDYLRSCADMADTPHQVYRIPATFHTIRWRQQPLCLIDSNLLLPDQSILLPLNCPRQLYHPLQPLLEL
jgi:hypothetical protein